MNDLIERMRYDPNTTQCEEAADRIEELEAEVEEQCRLNGMGAEREAALLGELERSRKDEMIAMSYLSETRMALGHDGDFPSMVEKAKSLTTAARMALEALIYCEALNSDVERQKIEAVNDLHTALGEKK